jgi:hypothetical protein
MSCRWDCSSSTRFPASPTQYGARLIAESCGWVTPQSSSVRNPLGIAWLAFLFDSYFAKHR